MASGSLSVIRRRWGGSSGSRTGSGTATASPGEGFQVALSCSRGSVSSVMLLLVRIAFRRRSVRLRRDPHGDGDQRADAEDPDEQALRDGSEGAQAESARRLVLLQEEQGRDDVALVLRGEVHVVEHRHVLGAG